MLSDLFRSPLRLTIDGKALTFVTSVDFDFALSSRVEVPFSKVTALMSLDAEALEHEAKSIRGVEKRFVDVLAKSLENPGSISSLLYALDLQNFTADHNWREIVTELREKPSRFDAYKQLALSKYLQYLSARQEVLRSIHSEKVTESEGGETATQSEGSGGFEANETIMFEVAEIGSPEFEQLPRGETTEARVGENGQLSIRLGGHGFTLLSGEPYRLVDDERREYPLEAGKNVVGRFIGNQVPIAPSYRDVSRKHVIVEAMDGGRVLLTDLSTHGTFVPAANLAAQN